MQFEPNTYLGDLKNAVATESKNGSPLIACEFEITHAASNGEWKAIIPDRRMVRFYMTDASWPHSKPRLESLGFNGNFQNPGFAKADQVQLSCSQETYEGKVKEKWDLADFGMSDIVPLSADKARVWSAKWKAETTQVAPPKGRPTPPARLETVPATPPAKVADEDIPF